MANKHIIDMTGERFGHWTVLEQDGFSYRGGSISKPNRIARWRCRCDCGVERSVDGVKLRNGKSRSCGHDERTLKKPSFADIMDGWSRQPPSPELVAEAKARLDAIENPAPPPYQPRSRKSRGLE